MLHQTRWKSSDIHIKEILRPFKRRTCCERLYLAFNTSVTCIKRKSLQRIWTSQLDVHYFSSKDRSIKSSSFETPCRFKVKITDSATILYEVEPRNFGKCVFVLTPEVRWHMRWGANRLLRNKMSKSNLHRTVKRFAQLRLKRKNMENDTYLYAEVTALKRKYSSLLEFVLTSQNASWRCCY